MFKDIKKIKLDLDGCISDSVKCIVDLYNEDFIDLTNVTDKELDLLKKTSGTAIGSSRFPLGDKEYEKIVDNLVKNNIGYLLFTGGNGSMDGLGKIYKHAKARNVDVACVVLLIMISLLLITHLDFQVLLDIWLQLLEIVGKMSVDYQFIV